MDYKPSNLNLVINYYMHELREVSRSVSLL